MLYKNATLWEVAYRRGKGILDVHGPLPDRSEAITEGRRGHHISH